MHIYPRYKSLFGRAAASGSLSRSDNDSESEESNRRRITSDPASATRGRRRPLHNGENLPATSDVI